MEAKPQFTIEDLWRLNDAEAEFVAEQSDEDLLADIREEGGDPQQIAAELDALVLRTYNQFKQESLQESRREYEESVSHLRRLSIAIPQTLKEKKEQFLASLLPSAGLTLATVQFRDLSDMSENDLEAYYRGCEYLNAVKSV